MTRSPLRTRLLEGAQGQLVVTVILLAASFAAQAGIARRFSLRGLGEYTGMTVVIFLASTLAISGLPMAVGERVARQLESHREADARASAGTGFALALALSLVAAVVVGLSWTTLADVLQLSAPPPSPVVAFAVVCAGILGYVPLVFQARFQMATVGLIAIAQPLTVVVALAIDTVAPGLRPDAMAVAGYVVAGVGALVAHAAAGHGFRVSARQLGPVWRQAMHSLPLLYANVLASWVDRLLISVLLGPTALGTYQAAGALIQGALRLPAGASSFLISVYARVSVQHAHQAGRLLGLLLRVWTAYAAVVTAGLIAAADGIVTTAFGGGSFAPALPLRIMALGLVPAVASLSLATAATGSGASEITIRVSRVTVPLQIALVTVLAVNFGIVGVAVANLGLMAMTFLGYSRLSPSRMAMSDRAIGGALFVGVASALLALGISALPIHWLARGVIGAAMAGLLVARTLLGDEERSVVRFMVLRLLRPDRSGIA